jgi:acetylornithine deacetylase
VGFEGAKRLVTDSQGYREIVEAQPLAIIGEPTHLSVVHAHKGIVAFRITSRGRAAHSSTTDGVNANEAMVPMLQTLLEIGQRARSEREYLDDRFDPPTLSWNFGVNDGSTAVNITPEKSVAWVSLRPMPEIDGEELIELAAQRAKSLGLEFARFEGGAPFWVDPDASSVRELCDLAGGVPQTVCYGTDGGEFTELQHRVVMGPGDISQAHTTDEWIGLDQLQKGAELYAKAIRRWCCGD